MAWNPREARHPSVVAFTVADRLSATWECLHDDRRLARCPVHASQAARPRRKSRQIMVGSVPVGGDAPVSVQSMTHDADVRHQRDAAADRRADGVRLPDRAGRRAERRTTRTRCRSIAKKSQIPVIADIHFQPKYVFAAIDAGLRGGAGEPGQHPQVRRPGQARSRGRPRTAGVPIRIGVNAGSLDPRLLREVRQGHPRGAGGVARCGRLACSRSTTSTTSRSRSSTTTRS